MNIFEKFAKKHPQAAENIKNEMKLNTDGVIGIEVRKFEETPVIIMGLNQGGVAEYFYFDLDGNLMGDENDELPMLQTENYKDIEIYAKANKIDKLMNKVLQWIKRESGNKVDEIAKRLVTMAEKGDLYLEDLYEMFPKTTDDVKALAKEIANLSLEPVSMEAFVKRTLTQAGIEITNGKIPSLVAKTLIEKFGIKAADMHYDLAKEFEKLGYDILGAGGNTEVYRKDLGDGHEIYVSDSSGICLPFDLKYPAIVGVYEIKTGNQLVLTEPKVYNSVKEIDDFAKSEHAKLDKHKEVNSNAFGETPFVLLRHDEGMASEHFRFYLPKKEDASIQLFKKIDEETSGIDISVEDDGYIEIFTMNEDEANEVLNIAKNYLTSAHASAGTYDVLLSEPDGSDAEIMLENADHQAVVQFLKEQNPPDHLVFILDHATQKVAPFKLEAESDHKIDIEPSKSSQETTELQAEIEKLFRANFPKAMYFSKVSQALGDAFISITLGVVPKGQHSSNIIDNDPAFHRLSIEGVNADGTLQPKLTVSAPRGGELLINPKPGSHMAFDGVKLGWKKKTGTKAQILNHLSKYFANMRKVVSENLDNIPLQSGPIEITAGPGAGVNVYMEGDLTWKFTDHTVEFEPATLHVKFEDYYYTATTEDYGPGLEITFEPITDFEKVEEFQHRMADNGMHVTYEKHVLDADNFNRPLILSGGYIRSDMKKGSWFEFGLEVDTQMGIVIKGTATFNENAEYAWSDLCNPEDPDDAEAMVKAELSPKDNTKIKDAMKKYNAQPSSTGGWYISTPTENDITVEYDADAEEFTVSFWEGSNAKPEDEKTYSDASINLMLEDIESAYRKQVKSQENKDIPLVERIVEYVNQLVDDETTHGFRSYSGRGMFGKECAAFTTSDNFSRNTILKEMDELDIESRRDSMGLGVVFYWPQVSMAEIKAAGGVVSKYDISDDDDEAESSVSANLDAVDDCDYKGYVLLVYPSDNDNYKGMFFSQVMDGGVYVDDTEYSNTIEEAKQAGKDYVDKYIDKGVLEDKSVQANLNPTPDEKLKILKKIVENKQADEIDEMTVDMQTANIILKVYDALSPNNKPKYMATPIKKMADFAWKAVAKVEGSKEREMTKEDYIFQIMTKTDLPNKAEYLKYQEKLEKFSLDQLKEMANQPKYKDGFKPYWAKGSYWKGYSVEKLKNLIRKAHRPTDPQDEIDEETLEEMQEHVDQMEMALEDRYDREKDDRMMEETTERKAQSQHIQTAAKKLDPKLVEELKKHEIPRIALLKDLHHNANTEWLDEGEDDKGEDYNINNVKFWFEGEKKGKWNPVAHDVFNLAREYNDYLAYKGLEFGGKQIGHVLGWGTDEILEFFEKGLGKYFEISEG
jgi:hypothetical protein